MHMEISTISCSRFDLSPMHMQRLPHHSLLNGHGSCGLGKGLQEEGSGDHAYDKLYWRLNLVMYNQIRDFEYIA